MKRWLLLLLVLLSLPVHAQETTAQTAAQTELYPAPGREYPPLTALPPQTSLAVQGRDATGLWLLVQNGDGARGWIITSQTALAGNLYALPIASDRIGAPTPDAPALSDNPDTLNTIERLRNTPILYNLDSPALAGIFARGQSMGSRADVFTKVGDSNTTTGDFLRPFGMNGDFCKLGDFSYLQPTIDYFRSAKPRDGEPNSFNSDSLAAIKGLSAAGALDPFWANKKVCQSGEGPVACEYRLVKPSVAIINLGLMDVRYKTEGAAFRSRLERVVKLSIDEGVIPVLNTIVVLPDQVELSFDKSIELDGIILDLADQYQIPLINLWRAVQTLPDYGIGPDRTHLKHAVGYYCDFTGPEQQYGGTLRNLLTLTALDTLRRDVLAKGG
jgi:hypothetical protein